MNKLISVSEPNKHWGIQVDDFLAAEERKDKNVIFAIFSWHGGRFRRQATFIVSPGATVADACAELGKHITASYRMWKKDDE